MFECKIGRETLYFSIENARGEGCGLRFYARIMLGSFSDRPRIGNDVSPVFGHFL